MQINPTTRFGIAASILTTAASIPFLASKADEPKQVPSPLPTRNSILNKNDFDMVQSLLKADSKTDLRTREIEWDKTVYPTVREQLIKLYTAEQEDIAALNSGKITEKDRKVKIAYTDFVPGGVDHGDDMGTQLMFHIVKYYDDKQSGRRIYVNEHWPISEDTGAILLPETIRTRVQAFDGALDKKGANQLFIPHMINIIWGINYDGSGGNSPFRASVYNQNFYGPYTKTVDKETKKETWANTRAQTMHIVSSPLSCIGCHTPREKRFEIKDSELLEILPKETLKLFDGSVTAQSEFEKPYNEQVGFKGYRKYLYERVRNGDISKENADSMLNTLLNSRNVAIPNMVQILKENTSLPWIGDDSLLDEYREIRRTDGFTYEKNEKTFVRAGLFHFPGSDLNVWWFRNEGGINSIRPSTSTPQKKQSN